MFSFRNVSAVAFLLFGTTFLWMTASFAGRQPPPKGTLWTMVNLLTVAAIASFTVAAWAVWKQTTWWEVVAVASAVVGLVSVVPYVIAIDGEGQLSDQGVALNIGIHAFGSLAVLAVALVPGIHHWFTQRWA